jgi:hypothetical protein
MDKKIDVRQVIAELRKGFEWPDGDFLATFKRTAKHTKINHEWHESHE